MTTTTLMSSVKDAWQKWLALAALVGALAAWMGLPARVTELERRVDAIDIVTRYMGCVMKAQAEQTDPRPCESHLSPDLVNYLRPGGGQ